MQLMPTVTIVTDIILNSILRYFELIKAHSSIDCGNCGNSNTIHTIFGVNQMHYRWTSNH